jgi:hypothetical protein
MMLKTTGLAAALSLACAPAFAAGLCPAWSAPEKAGTLDMMKLNNTSGLTASRAYPGRLYHHNDAQGGPKFFTTDMTGGALKEVVISGFSPMDLEEVSTGKCAGAASCVVFADFGDNPVTRPVMTFAVLAEKASFADTEAPLRLVNARYPDGPHNPEGMFIHPNGDLYLITKIATRETMTMIFRLKAAQLSVADGSVQTLEKVAEVDLAKLMTPPGGAAPARRPMATGMDVSADGKTFVVLTYSGAVELAFDLALPLPPQSEWQEGRDYRRIATATNLPQAEGITYTPDGKAILYTSEFMNGGAESPIMRQRCTG